MADDKYCTSCKKELSTTKFYNSRSILDTDGLSHVCKTCMEKLINLEDMNTVYSVLMSLNIPFDYKHWESAEKAKGKTFGNYMRMANSLPQLKNGIWNDSVFNDKTNEDISDGNIELSDEDIKKLEKDWGVGFSPSQYIRLDNFYQEFAAEYETDSPAQRLNFRNASRTQLQTEEALAKNDTDTFNKLMKTMSIILGDSNVKPVQETGAEASDQLCFGNFLKKWENDRPVYDENLTDPMKEYIDLYMVGHLAKMEGLNNDLVDKYNEALKEYSVEFGKESSDGDDE